MTAQDRESRTIRVADLAPNRPYPFALEPDAEARAALATDLGLSAIRKLRFEGALKPLGRNGWRLEAQLGATVVQPCVVTLAPVTTRIDTEVARQFVPEDQMARFEPGSEVEMPEDDSTEQLGTLIDPAAVMAEALALAVPDYPRADGAELEQAEARPAGAAPIVEEEVKPFAGLAALRDRMSGGDDEDGGS